MKNYILFNGEKFFSKKYGIINSLYERRAPSSISTNRDIVSRISIKNSNYITGGGNLFKKDASVAAIGEAIERYCLQSYDESNFTRSSYIDLDNNKPGREQLKFFLKEQYKEYSLPYFPMDCKINWVVGRSFVNSNQYAIPASLVYLPYTPLQNEPALSAQLSPGTACHYDFEQATLTAVIECIERDSFTLFWETGIHFPLIPREYIVSHLKYKKICWNLGEIYCLDITTDVNVPVILTLLLSRNASPPFVSIGIAAALDPINALDKSIFEALTSWRSSYEIAKNRTLQAVDLVRKLTTQPDYFCHAMYHCFIDTREYFYELLSGCPDSNKFIYGFHTASRVHSCSENICLLRTSFIKLGYDVAIVDITTDEVREHGLYVIRTISFDLVRPSLGLIFRHLNNQRFINVPKKLGLLSIRNTMSDILQFRVPAP